MLHITVVLGFCLGGFRKLVARHLPHSTREGLSVGLGKKRVSDLMGARAPCSSPPPPRPVPPLRNMPEQGFKLRSARIQNSLSVEPWEDRQGGLPGGGGAHSQVPKDSLREV